VEGAVNELAGTVSATQAFTSAGVYNVELTVSDACGGSSTANQVDGIDAMVVVYDPSAGFVTGGGWFDSPAGAYLADLDLTGKANFGFVSKYQKGKSIPSGETEFQFKAGSLNFKSTAYDWLVISGARAQYKGSGTINGAGDYGFLLTAIDGQLAGGGGEDRFRIKLVDKGADAIVYDNQPGMGDSGTPSTTLGGGSIVIHASGGAMAASPVNPDAPAPPTGQTTVDFVVSPNSPNPFHDRTSIPFGLAERSQVTMAVFDLAGREVRRLADSELEAGAHTAIWDGRDRGGRPVKQGVYFLEFTASHANGRFTARRRLVVF
jgi:hypothetical protein